jgi:periplasmic divalent cation tolerance protein
VADCWQVTTTVATGAEAQRIAAALVEERLAACVQIAGPIASTYRWQGTVEQATEWYCHCKTTRARYPALEARLRELHPYETPEIIAVPIVAALPAYLAWIEECVR